MPTFHLLNHMIVPNLLTISTGDGSAADPTPTVIQSVFNQDVSSGEAVVTGQIPVIPHVTYRIQMELRRRDAFSDEQVTDVTFDGQSIGACNPKLNSEPISEIPPPPYLRESLYAATAVCSDVLTTHILPRVPWRSGQRILTKSLGRGIAPK